MNIATLLIFTSGALLLYSAVTGKNPIEVVKESLGQAKATPKYKLPIPDSSNEHGKPPGE